MDKDSQVYIGTAADGVPIHVNKYYYNSDLKILTGYVEPHLFAGFHAVEALWMKN